MNQFKITLVKQSKKPDPKTGRKKRTKQPLSRPKKINFNIKIHKDEKENKNMKINMPNTHRENPYEFKIKIHKGDETIENLTDNVVNTEEDKFHFNTRILKSVEAERSDKTHDPVMTTVQINKPFEFIPDSNEPRTKSEEDFEIEEETEEVKIPSEEEIQSDEEDEDFEDETEEDVYEAEEETEEIESDEEEVSNELEEAGIDESVFDTITVNGEVMNAVELNSEEEEEEFDDEVPPYEEEEDYSYEDLIPSKYNKKINSSKKGKKKSIENEF